MSIAFLKGKIRELEEEIERIKKDAPDILFTIVAKPADGRHITYRKGLFSTLERARKYLPSRPAEHDSVMWNYDVTVVRKEDVPDLSDLDAPVFMHY